MLRLRAHPWVALPLLLVLALAAIFVIYRWGAASHPTATSSKPNVILINTDDQRWDTLWAMPRVRQLLAKNGVTFSNSFVTTSQCCPSRASLFTGEYSRHTGVYQNAPPHGGALAFDDRSTIATWLHAAGYTTGLIGKYLNGYAQVHSPTYVPPGWDTFDAMVDPATRYYDYTLNENGTLRSFGSSPSDYATTVERSLAVRFVQEAGAPFFLYVAPAAPHGPAIPDRADIGTFADLAPLSGPAVDEPDVADKPWGGLYEPLGSKAISKIQHLRQRMLESLRAVDRMVADLVGAVRERGALGNTVFVFTSDNGIMWGEHRLKGKIWPYEPSIRVPLVISAPWTAGSARNEARMVLNIDMASTLAELAGARPGLPQDGMSLVPLLRGKPGAWRTAFVVEYLGQGRLAKKFPPPFEAIRTERYLYVAYNNAWRELYDLRTDPDELSNLAGSTSSRQLASTLAAQLHTMLGSSPR